MTIDWTTKTLPAMCMDLHMCHTGASDLSPEDYAAGVLHLTSRVTAWQLPFIGRRWSVFDTAVLSLCLATLAEGQVLDREGNGRGPEDTTHRKAPDAGRLTSLTSTEPATVSVAGVATTLPAAIVAGQDIRVTGTTTGSGAGCCPSWRWHDWAKMCEPVDRGGLGFYMVREYGVRGVVQFVMDSEELVVAEWYTDSGKTTIHRRGTPQRYGPCCATKEEVVEWVTGLL